MKHYLSALLSLLAVGCSSTYQQADLQALTSKLDASQGVLISQPQDGSYETTQYQNSGQMTAQVIYAAFSKKAQKVELTTHCHGDPCLNSIEPTQFREGANKRGNSSRLTQSFHFFSLSRSFLP